MEQAKKKRNIWKRLARIVLKTILFIFLFLVLIIILIQTPPVQNFIRKQAVSYLQKKLDTKVGVGRLYINFTKKVVLEDIYVEDRQHDTLLYGGNIKVDVNLVKLAFGNFEIKEVQLEDITAKIKRQLPDTVFNFQFIVDAFTSPSEPKEKTDTSASSPIPIRSVRLDRIRVVYKDVITGNDAEAWLDHLDTKIQELDPGQSIFNIPRTHIAGLTARIYQSKPLATPDPPAKDMIEAKEPIPMQLSFKELDLQKIKIDFRNDVSAFYANLDLDAFNVKPRHIDLDQRVIDLDQLRLQDTKASILMGRKEQSKIVEQEVEQEAQSQKEAGWRITVNTLRLDNNFLRFDNDNSPRQPSGMDYAHIYASPLTLHADKFLLSTDTISGRISKASIAEQSGFVLEELKVDFLYSPQGASLEDLYLKTPGTELKRSAVISYPSLEALKDNIGAMQLDLRLDESRLQVKDVLTFVPSLKTQPAFANPSVTWYINSRITGSVADMKIDALQVSGLQHTRLDVNGRVRGLPDMNKMSADLTIKNISSSRSDIQQFVPRKSLPQNITLPQQMGLSGNLKGSMGDLSTHLALFTDLGNATVSGRLQQITDARRAGYDMTVETKSLDLGTILQNKENLGPVTASFTVKGNGYDTRTARANLDGTLHSAVLKGYNYRNLKLHGAIADQQAVVDAGIVDPNIHIALQATADLSQEYPAVKLNTMIDSIKMQELHLTPDRMVFRGKITADFPGTNPDSLEGKLLVTDALLVRADQRARMDTISLQAGHNDSGQYISLQSDAVMAQLQGQYKLTQFGDIIQRSIEPYFAVQRKDTTSGEPFNFTLDAAVVNGPMLQAFLPDLKRMDSLTLHSRFSNDAGWSADIKAPIIELGANKINGLDVTASTGDSAINIKATVQELSSGNSIQLYKTTIDATLANNNIDLNLNIKDKGEKDKYNLGALVQQPETGSYVLSLKPNNLLLNYDRWGIASDNSISYSPKGITANNFELTQGSQKLRINSVSAEPDAPLEVDFSAFRISTLTGFVQSDSVLVDGVLNGKAEVREIMKEPLFTADLKVDDLSIKKDTVGNVAILVNNKVTNIYDADITITGRGNDVQLTGNYNVATSTADMNLDLRTLPMTTAQALSGGAIREATGSLNGKFSITGSIAKPVVKGDLNFDKTGFNLSMLNNYFRIDQEKIQVNENGLRFDHFSVKDSANNELTVNGTAATNDFASYKLDLDIDAKNFRALNSTKRDNQLFYGQLYFDADLSVSGTADAPIVDGRFKVNEKTKMTIVLPQSEPGVVDREGVVEFVDMDAPLNDSLFLAAYDSMNVTSIKGIQASVNVEIDKAAELTLIVDEGNGDFLNVKGEAMLNASINQSGDLTLAGTYELEDGAYELSFNGIRRRFTIQKGSKLTWGGEPTDADVDITAIYVANTAPLDLVKNQLGEDVATAERNTYLQKLPFEVHLSMVGKLLQPKITFDIILPDDKSYVVSNDIITTVRTKLEQLRQEEGEMNKQVFALLLLNRFIAENPFNSSSSVSATTLARQSVSKLMTEQLNRLASDLVKGVDLNFDVQSSDDYTTGQREDRTDLNVGLSKRLLNDRLTVSVGSNFELEGPQNSNQQASNIAGNIAVDYRLSKDGRYRLRAYRKNEYQGVIEGYIIETGVGFIITLDYNRFRDIFRQKQIEKRREEARKRKEQEEQREREKNKKEQTSGTTNP